MKRGDSGTLTEGGPFKDPMTSDRWDDIHYRNQSITPEEFERGWHFCPDWDLLLVGPGMEELSCCTCRWDDASIQAKLEFEREWIAAFQEQLRRKLR